jgi:hypothetical protein
MIMALRKTATMVATVLDLTPGDVLVDVAPSFPIG